MSLGTAAVSSYKMTRGASRASSGERGALSSSQRQATKAKMATVKKSKAESQPGHEPSVITVGSSNSLARIIAATTW